MGPIARRRAVALVATVVLLASLMAAFAQDEQPEMYVPELKHDFGEVFEQEKFEHTFVIENHGKADLIIDNVKPG